MTRQGLSPEGHQFKSRTLEVFSAGENKIKNVFWVTHGWQEGYLALIPKPQSSPCYSKFLESVFHKYGDHWQLIIFPVFSCMKFKVRIQWQVWFPEAFSLRFYHLLKHVYQYVQSESQHTVCAIAVCCVFYLVCVHVVFYDLCTKFYMQWYFILLTQLLVMCTLFNSRCDTITQYYEFHTNSLFLVWICDWHFTINYLL